MTEVPPPPPSTTVIGYPDAPGANAPASAAAASADPGLRSQVRTVRALVAACLALLVLLAVGIGLGLASSRTQVADLSAQVAALQEQVAAVAAAGAAPAAQPAAPAPAQEESMAQLGAPTDLPAGTSIPAGVDTTGAILIGDPRATDVVEVYIDYQCPFCQRWEAQYGTALAERALTPGSGLLLKQYNLAFLGETSPDLAPAGASARAASAAACVLETDGVEVFTAFNQAVFASADPNEPAGQFTADVLTRIAEQAGASPAAVTCIEEERNVPFVAATTKAGFGRGVGGTPTVVINGRTLGNPFTDPDLSTLAGAG